MNLKITFLGGAETVTGSKYLLTAGTKKILIDCGLFQGVKEQRLLNWQTLPVDPRTIDGVILTHAHLDHTGYLPLLVRQGFRGPIYCSEPTRELTKLILLDAAKIQEEDAETANQGGWSRHKPALPLYRTADAEAVFGLFCTLEPDRWLSILSSDLKVRLTSSGHILGSTFVEIQAEDQRLVFSGDVGRSNPITLNPPKTLERADFLWIEATYGDRCHPQDSPAEKLARIIHETAARGGHVLIPSFSVGRTQDVLHLIATLKATSAIPQIPVYLDSPMAAKATALFDRYRDWHRVGTPDLHGLSDTFQHVSSVAHSMSICSSKEPSIVLAGSGMMTGGRIKHHLASRLPRSENSVVIVGYQAAGTLGRFLREGASEAKIFGKYFPVRARIEEISSLSSHADQKELLDWIGGFRETPKKIFLVHGEANGLEGLRVRIRDRFGVVCHIAKLGESVELALSQDRPEVRQNVSTGELPCGPASNYRTLGR